MKKNAILALIMAASITIAMTSCGTSDEEVSNGTEQPSYNEAMGIDGAVTEADEEVVIEPVQEILDASPDSKKIQLGNHVFTLPVKLEDILNSGAVVTNDVNPINDVIEGWTSEYVDFNIDDCNYSLPFSNANYPEQVKVQFKDGFNSVGVSEESNIIFPKGISVGSTVDELKSAWSEPTTDNINEYIYSLDGIDYSISIDLENKSILRIMYNCKATQESSEE